MKKIFIIMISLANMSMFAQNDVKKSVIGIEATGKLGFSKLIQKENVDLNGTISASDILLTYNISKKFLLQTGVGFLDFNANGTTNGNSYSLEQNHLRIPVIFVMKSSLLKEQLQDSFQYYFGFGVYGNTILKEEIKSVTETIKNKNLGWNVGIGINLGLRYEVLEDLVFGIGFESQTDMTKMKKNGAERKLEKINTANFTIGYRFN